MAGDVYASGFLQASIAVLIVVGVLIIGIYIVDIHERQLNRVLLENARAMCVEVRE